MDDTMLGDNSSQEEFVLTRNKQMESDVKARYTPNFSHLEAETPPQGQILRTDEIQVSYGGHSNDIPAHRSNVYV